MGEMRCREPVVYMRRLNFPADEDDFVCGEHGMDSIKVLGAMLFELGHHERHFQEVEKQKCGWIDEDPGRRDIDGR